jgi:Novel STAND NTPase 1
MIKSGESQTNLQRLVAAYKLRLAQKAAELRLPPQTWRRQTISLEAEQRLVAGEDQHHLSPCPYPGLRSFNPQEGEFFFGHLGDVRQVHNLLNDQRLVVVMGGSASGMSSLVRAGVLPCLNTTHPIRSAQGNWHMAERIAANSTMSSFRSLIRCVRRVPSREVS